jgi:hypothetical protein
VANLEKTRRKSRKKHATQSVTWPFLALSAHAAKTLVTKFDPKEIENSDVDEYSG